MPLRVLLRDQYRLYGFHTHFFRIQGILEHPCVHSHYNSRVAVRAWGTYHVL